MEAIFLRILSLILSALMFLFNTFSAVFPGLFPDEPIENVIGVYDAELFELDGDTVVSDYVSWYEIVGNKFDKYDWKYFFKCNLALVSIELPDPGCTIEIGSVTENSDTLEIEYSIISAEGEYAAVECPKVILIETSKNISLIEATETAKPEDPMICNGYNYRLADAENFNENNYYSRWGNKISSFEDWQEYFTGSDKNLSAYDENYFAEKSLTVYYMNIPYENKELTVRSIKQDNNGFVHVECQVSDSEKKSPAATSAIVVEIEKDSLAGYAKLFGLMDEAEVFDTEYNFKEFVREDGHTEIVSDYKTWYKYAETFYFDSNIINGEFFSEKSLALITVMLPTRDYKISVDPLVKNGNTVDVSYSVSKNSTYSSGSTIVHYAIIVAEISKDVTAVNVTENGFKNRFNEIPTSNLDIPEYGEVTLVSDYDEWSDTVKTDIPALKKYDEEYFKNYAVVLIPEVFNDYIYNVEMIKLYENGDTVEIIYGINGEKDPDMIYPAVVDNITILVEVTKNIKNVSASRKNTENAYLEFNHMGPFNFSEDYIIISDYETWTSCVTKENENIAKYTEDYFEYNSVALFVITTPNTDGTVYPYYIYEEDGVLNFGYDIINDSMFPALGSKTVLVEVSKDVTEINLEKIK